MGIANFHRKIIRKLKHTLMDRARAITDTPHLGEVVQAFHPPVYRKEQPAQRPKNIPRGPMTTAELLESGLLLKYPGARWFPAKVVEVMPVTLYILF